MATQVAHNSICMYAERYDSHSTCRRDPATLLCGIVKTMYSRQQSTLEASVPQGDTRLGARSQVERLNDAVNYEDNSSVCVAVRAMLMPGTSFKLA